MAEQTEARCWSVPPEGGTWGDCWCTLPAGHDGECRCEPCTDRFNAPSWPNQVGAS
ncbi:hypothetical protein [Glycomyces sp. NPDC021274]|uniref:hypothetical protein n=1 Tax=Glycomyces sp. NPDC021274 TaxID=3155120 RepID=UPI00340D2BE6